MTPDEIRAQVERAARSFDAVLHTGDYACVHGDAAQLERLLAWVAPRDGERILDLGTGGGYVAFALAAACPGATVVGIDVAREAIAEDARIAARKGLANVRFEPGDGVLLPFPDRRFDAVVSRYAFHHLPRPELTLAEVARTLAPGGRLVLSDAVREDDDRTDFVNAFQTLKGDRHVRMLRAGELLALVERHGFERTGCFETALTFTRRSGPAYEALLATTPRRVLDAYRLAVAGGEMRLTFRILNARFARREGGAPGAAPDGRGRRR